MNDVLLAPRERMTIQTAVDGATLLQQQAEWHLVDTAILRCDAATRRSSLGDRAFAVAGPPAWNSRLCNEQCCAMKTAMQQATTTNNVIWDKPLRSNVAADKIIFQLRLQCSSFATAAVLINHICPRFQSYCNEKVTTFTTHHVQRFANKILGHSGMSWPCSDHATAMRMQFSMLYTVSNVYLIVAYVL